MKETSNWKKSEGWWGKGKLRKALEIKISEIKARRNTSKYYTDR